jgi:hypothetical protein
LPASPSPLRPSATASRVAGLVSLAVLGALATPAGVDGQPAPTAAQVKAAYVYNFANFVTWPPSSFDGPNGPLHVCVAGDPEMAPNLESTFQNEIIAAHPVRVRRDPPPADRRRCHILYLSGSAAVVQATLKSLVSAPVLTVGSGDRFVEAGGMLAFVPEGKRIRFDVNLRGATAAGLTLSSQLLQVARRVQQ